MNKKIFTSFLFLFLWGGLSSAYSQEGFSELGFTITANNVMGGNTMLKYWSPTPGIGFEVSTPYYVGKFELGARYNRYNELEFEDSGFHSTYIFVGWHYVYFASQEHDLSIAPGIRFGTRYMAFDGEKIYRDEYRFSRFESEFSYEAHFRIQYRINKTLEFYTSVAINQTRFKIPYAEWLGTAGFSVIFNTSEGLENFLK